MHLMHKHFLQSQIFFNILQIKKKSNNDARKAIRFTLKEIPLVMTFSPLPNTPYRTFYQSAKINLSAKKHLHESYVKPV